MNADSKRLRAALVKRSEGFCECGCGEWAGEAGQMDHFWGRGAGRPAESEATCWILVAHHHHEKTTNSPSAAHWLGVFAAHCFKYGYELEAERAATKLAVLLAKGLAA